MPTITPAPAATPHAFCLHATPFACGDFNGWQDFSHHIIYSGEREPMRPRSLSFDARYAWRKWCDVNRSRSCRSRSHSRSKAKRRSYFRV